jgi:hypothetical protein
VSLTVYRRTYIASSISVLTVAQPPSLDERFKDTRRQLFAAIDLLDSQHAQMNPDWYAKFCDSGTRFFKFVEDNIRDETRRTLPKTNEHDRRNQPLPNNVIGRRFGTFTRSNYPEQ